MDIVTYMVVSDNSSVHSDFGYSIIYKIYLKRHENFNFTGVIKQTLLYCLYKHEVIVSFLSDSLNY